MKKQLTTLLAIILILSMAACSKSDTNNKSSQNAAEPTTSNSQLSTEAETSDTEEASDDNDDLDAEISTGDLIVGQNISDGYQGSDPVTLYSRFGSLKFPEGVNYKLSTLPPDDTATATLEFWFGKGNTNAGRFTISTTRMIESLEDAVNECIRMNDFGSLSSTIGDEISYGGITYKNLSIHKDDGSEAKYFLVTYYETEDGRNGYVEVQVNGQDGGYYKLDIDDPIVIEMLESLVLK